MEWHHNINNFFYGHISEQTTIGEFKLQIINIVKNDIFPKSIFNKFGGKTFAPICFPYKKITIKNVKMNTKENESLNYKLLNSKINLISMTWNPSKQQLALAIENQGIFFYNINKKMNKAWEPKTLFHPLMHNIKKIKYHPLGTILAIINSSGIFLWRFRSIIKKDYSLEYEKKIKGVFMMIRLHKNCENLEFSPCGRYFVSWTINGELRLWECILKQPYITLRNCNDKIINVSWGEENLVVAYEQKILIYNTETWNYHKYNSEQDIIMGLPTLKNSVFLIATKKYIHWIIEKQKKSDLGIKGFHLKIKKELLRIKKLILSPDNSRISIIFEHNMQKLTRSIGLIAIEGNILKPIGFIHAPMKC